MTVNGMWYIIAAEAFQSFAVSITMRTARPADDCRPPVAMDTSLRHATRSANVGRAQPPPRREGRTADVKLDTRRGLLAGYQSHAAKSVKCKELVGVIASLSDRLRTTSAPRGFDT